jgi:hypothetical protein
MTMTSSKENVVELPDSMQGKLLDGELQKLLVRSREKGELARAQTDRNRWFFVSLILMTGILLFGYGWYTADARFAENVRIAWVKLDPSGGYTIEFDDTKNKDTYFKATLDSKLFEWVERRFSKDKYTISDDYGFAYILMSPALKKEFLDEYDAARVASEHEKCIQCDQVEYKVRVVEHIDEMTLGPGDSEEKIYHSIAYATEYVRNSGGKLYDKSNQIINLVWRFKTKKEIISEKDNLRYNPIGIEIIRYSKQEDKNTLLEEPK